MSNKHIPAVFDNEYNWVEYYDSMPLIPGGLFWVAYTKNNDKNKELNVGLFRRYNDVMHDSIFTSVISKLSLRNIDVKYVLPLEYPHMPNIQNDFKVDWIKYNRNNPSDLLVEWNQYWVKGGDLDDGLVAQYINCQFEDPEIDGDVEYFALLKKPSNV